MESFDKDRDLAFQLQLQETMTYSLLEPFMEETSDQNTDCQTLELCLKLEQEHHDAAEWETEMLRIRENLKIQSHDQKFAQEILHIPDDEWEDYGSSVHKPFGEVGSSSEAVIDDAEPFKLYFKGLYNKEKVYEGLEMVSVAAIGAAVCDPGDNLILNIQKHLVGDWEEDDWETDDLQFKIEVNALIEGLNAALSLGIKCIDIFCDYYPLFHYITMNSRKKQQKTDQLSLIRQNFDSFRQYFVARKDVKFAFKLARDAMDIQITKSAECSHARSTKEKCTICLENCNVNEMFAVESCFHSYCKSCIKQHIEVKLHHGVLPRCPFEHCSTELHVQSCRKFVSPELIDLMNQLINESSIPLTEKIYCPYPRCSVLMSKSEVLPYNDAVFIEWCSVECIKCHGIFCINCEVPWHSDLSCSEYKRLNPSPSTEDAKLKSLATKSSWRQCIKCKNMIELVEGCYHVACRCGYEFCYTCGAEWSNKKATCTCPIWDERNIVND